MRLIREASGFLALVFCIALATPTGAFADSGTFISGETIVGLSSHFLPQREKHESRREFEARLAQSIYATGLMSSRTTGDDGSPDFGIGLMMRVRGFNRPFFMKASDFSTEDRAKLIPILSDKVNHGFSVDDVAYMVSLLSVELEHAYRSADQERALRKVRERWALKLLHEAGLPDTAISSKQSTKPAGSDEIQSASATPSGASSRGL